MRADGADPQRLNAAPERGWTMPPEAKEFGPFAGIVTPDTS